jgi:hypothetical protein
MSARETNHWSTAEAFHLIEDVAAMPVLALTAGILGSNISDPVAHAAALRSSAA